MESPSLFASLNASVSFEKVEYASDPCEFQECKREKKHQTPDIFSAKVPHWEVSASAEAASI